MSTGPDPPNSDDPAKSRPHEFITADWRDYPTLTDAILHTVASAMQCEPDDLPPLSRTMPPDALESMLTMDPDRAGREPPVRITFPFVGSVIYVDTHGTVAAWPRPLGNGAEFVPPETPEELQSRLGQLLRKASGNGISVRGGWAIRNGTEMADWDVHITRVSNGPGEDSGRKTDR